MSPSVINSSVDRTLSWLTRCLSTATAIAAFVLTAVAWVAVESDDLSMPVRVSRLQADAQPAGLPEEVSAAIRSTRHVSSVAWFVIRLDQRYPPTNDTLLVFDTGLNEIESLWALPEDGVARGVALQPSSIGPTAAVLDASGQTTTWLARFRSPGIGKPKARLVARAAVPEFERLATVHSTAYTAVFLVLASFSAFVAIAALEPTFLLLAAWLLTTLRVLAVNEGWGLNWLSTLLGPTALAILMPATLAIHGVFTIALFRTLMGLGRLPRWPDRLLVAVQIAFCVLAPLAMVLPVATTYRIFWLTSMVAILISIPSTCWVAWRHRDPVAASISFAWVFVLVGLAREMLYNLGALSTNPGWLNASVASVFGAALCALSLAYRLREESLGRARASSARRRAEAELRRSYDEMPIGLFTCNQQGELVRHNRAFSLLYQRLRGTLPMTDEPVVASLVNDDQVRSIMASSLTHESAVITTTSVTDGGRLTLSIRARAQNSFIECSVEDITQRIEAEAALARMADHDALTEALNLRGLHGILDVALARARLQVECGLIVIDIDRFKVLNELYGFATADSVLVNVAQRIRPLLGAGDSLARVSDSFHLVCIDRNIEALDSLAHRLLEAITSQPFDVAGRSHDVTASVGLVALEAAMESRDAIAAATQACDAAKNRGRNRVLRTMGDSAVAGYLEELKVQADLHSHLSQQRFYLEFQPIVSLHDGFGQLAYEVLVRMRGPDGQRIDPSRFIPAAERNGQMPYIDRWVLAQTLGFLHEHPEHAAQLRYAAINVSGASLNDSRFIDECFSILSGYPELVGKLCFEITETVAIADRVATRAFTDRIQSMGGKVALDDFGAGFTSFTGLRDLGANIIKIDGSFVRDLHVNPANHSIARMLCHLSHEMGMECVAEWVENAEIARTLIEMGVDYGQGFGLVRPIDPKRVLAVHSAAELVENISTRAVLERAAPLHGPGSLEIARR